MTWVRLDDSFGEHPKIAKVTNEALALWVTGLAYCNRNLTDGFIPTSVGIGQLRFCDDPVFAVSQLEETELWELVAGGWQVHDYLDYNPTREHVLAEREKKQAAGRAGGRASAQARGQAPASNQAPAQAPAQAKAKQNPTPVPVPVPKAVQEPPPAANAAAVDYFEEGKWRHLLDKLYDHGYTDSGRGALTWAMLMKLRLKYGASVVDAALSDASLGEGVPLGSSAAYFESICARFKEAS